MRKFTVILAAMSLLCLLFVGTALANEKNLKKTITFKEDVMINDTMVKKGEYDVKFDSKTNEVSLLKRGEVVLTTKANVEMRADKARYNSASFKATDKGTRLDTLTFAGDRRAIVLTDTGNSTADK